MAQYSKTALPSFLSVESITTIFRQDMSHSVSAGGEAHDFCELLYVQQGLHHVAVDGVPFTVGEGQMIVYAPNAHHRMIGKSTALVGIISFGASESMSFFYNRVITLNSRQREAMTDIVAYGMEIFRPSDTSGLLGMVSRDGTADFQLQELKLRLELLLLDIYKDDLATGVKKTVVTRENYREAQFKFLRAYLVRNLTESLTLSRMASDCSMSATKIKDIFRENGKKPPMTYFMNLKIEEARRLIVETSLNFTEIAARLGFSSVHYFSKVFKDHLGMTPTAYAHSMLKK